MIDSATCAGATPSAERASNPWWAVLSVALTAAVFCSTEFLPVGLLRFVSEDLGVSEGHAGLMVSLPGLLAAISAPLLTVLVGKRDRRQVLWALGLLLVAANLVAAVAPNFGTLLGAGCSSASALAGSGPLARALADGWWREVRWDAPRP